MNISGTFAPERRPQAPGLKPAQPAPDVGTGGCQAEGAFQAVVRALPEAAGSDMLSGRVRPVPRKFARPLPQSGTEDETQQANGEGANLAAISTNPLFLPSPPLARLTRPPADQSKGPRAAVPLLAPPGNLGGGVQLAKRMETNLSPLHASAATGESNSAKLPPEPGLTTADNVGKGAPSGGQDRTPTVLPQSPPTETPAQSLPPGAHNRAVADNGARALGEPPPGRETEGGNSAGAGSAKTAGMSAAQTVSAMKPAAQLDDFACLTVQEMPGSEAPARESVSNLSGWTIRNLRRGQHQLEPVQASAPVGAMAAAVRPISAEWINPATVPGEAHWLRQLETSVHQLASTGTDHLTLVVKPDEQTAIRLEFRLHDGQVEARAQCERGSFAQLNAEWGQLQQALSSSGVRLSPLVVLPDRGEGSSGLGSSSFDAAGSSSQQDHSRSARADFDLGPDESRPGADPRRASQVRQLSATRLLERWA